MDYTDINFEANYEGYIWMSDSPKPDVLRHTNLDKSVFEQGNPFVIEGQLFDKENKKSLSIKYVDGSYLIHSYDVTNEEIEEEKKQKKYISNRIDNKKLKFIQRWRTQEDEFCEGMPSLQPAELVFVGFGDTNNNKED